MRGAKSELLRAKAAVEAAKVAEVEAQAALLQAQAAVEQANAVKVQAEAEKVRAEAAIAQAKADYINAKTEEAKAEAQAKIDENNRLQAEWEEKAAVRQAEAEAAIKEAELRAATALAQYQAALVSLQEAKNNALNSYITKLETATEEYYTALDELRQAQRDYNSQSATVEENEASKALLTRDLQREVYVQQAAYDGAKATLDEAQANLDEAKTLEPHDLANKLAEVVEKQQTIQKEIADLSLKAAEEVVKIYNEQEIPLNNLQQEITDLQNDTRDIAAVEFDFSGDGSGYPLYVQRGTFKLDALEYSYINDGNYQYRKQELQFWIDEFKRWTRDENDNAWTNDRIANLEGEAAAVKKQMDEVMKLWKEAIEAYKQGAYAQTDPSKITGYSDVTTALTAFNTSAKAANDANATYQELIQQQPIDEKAYYDALLENAKTRQAAVEEAEETYAKDWANRVNIYNERKKGLDDRLKRAQKTYDEATEALQDLAGSTDADALAAAIAAQQVALTNLTAAQTAYDNCTQGAIDSEITTAHTNAINAAYTAETTANNAAWKAYDDKWNSTDGTEYVKVAPALADVEAAEKDLLAKRDALVKAANNYNDNVPELASSFGSPIDANDIYALANGTWNAELGYSVRKTDTTPDKIITLTKDGMEYVIGIRSEALYGQGYAEKNAYGDNISRLVEMTDEEILAEVDKAMDALVAQDIDITFDMYINECYNYGLAGERLALLEEARIAKTWLTNEDIVNAKINQAETALNDLNTGYEALADEIEAKEKEFELAQETLNDAYAETLKPIEAKRAEAEPLNGLYNAVISAIQDYVAAGEPVWDTQSIANYITECEDALEWAQLNLYDAETLLLNAQDRLNKWNSDAIDWLEVLAQKVEDAQIKVDRKKAKVDEVQAALDAAIAALTNDPTTASTQE